MLTQIVYIRTSNNKCKPDGTFKWITSSFPDVVKKETAKAWKAVFAHKTPKSALHIDYGPSFNKKRWKIRRNDSNSKLLHAVTAEELRTYIMYQRNKKSPGVDGIPNEIWKLFNDTPVVLQTLAVIFTACLAHGYTSKK